MTPKHVASREADEKIKEFLESELGDYSYFKYEIVELDENDYKIWGIHISTGGEYFKTVYFRYNLDKKILEVELGEDNWEEIEHFDWTVKYFWMALLEWK